MICVKCKKVHDESFGSGKYCSRSCANSRKHSPNTKQKISKSVKKAVEQGCYENVVRKGVKLPPRSAAHCNKISKNRKEYWTKIGRKTEDEYRAGNKANVYAYRARKRNAIPNDADLRLIKRIYSLVPEGYQVDHIVALAAGGQHHQDNLQYLIASENARKGKNNTYDKSKVIRWQDIVRM